MFKTYLFLGLIGAGVIGWSAPSHAMYLLSALGAEETAQVAETVLNTKDLEAAKVEPAAGEDQK